MGVVPLLKLEPSNASVWEQTGFTSQVRGPAFARQVTSMLFQVAFLQQLLFPLYHLQICDPGAIQVIFSHSIQRTMSMFPPPNGALSWFVALIQAMIYRVKTARSRALQG